MKKISKEKQKNEIFNARKMKKKESERKCTRLFFQLNSLCCGCKSKASKNINKINQIVHSLHLASLESLDIILTVEEQYG